MEKASSNYRQETARPGGGQDRCYDQKRGAHNYNALVICHKAEADQIKDLKMSLLLSLLTRSYTTLHNQGESS